MYRAIIADDEKIIRTGLEELINSYDINLKVVAKAKDGPSALELIKRHKPEIILMDINMPFANGLDIIEKVNEIDPYSKKIIISGYDEFNYAQRALNLGVFSYLLKPLDYRNFKDVLIKAMESYSERMWEVSKLKTDDSNSVEKIDIGNKAIDYIKQNYTNSDLNVQQVADNLFISRSYLTKLIKGKTGNNFTDYLNKLRIDTSINFLLDNKDLSIKEIAEKVGYNSQHYFSRAFKNYTGLSPIQYKNKFKTN